MKNIEQTEVQGFSNIDDCLFELSLTEEPFIVVTDIDMPERSGVSLITELRRFQYTHGLLIVSGVASDITDTLAIMASFSGIPLVKTLSKPLNINAVKTTLVEMLALSQSTLSLPPKKSERNFSKEELLTFLLEGSYHPYYQPQVCAQSGQTLGVEMLGRIHLNGKIYTPDYFIDKLIEYGYITDYTYALLEKGITLFKSYDFAPLTLSINVEYCSLQEPDFYLKVTEILTRLQFNPHHLIIELTEHESDITMNLMANLSELRVIGVEIAADDFGMGMSGLNELLNLPFREVKIDRSFVAEYANNSKSFNVLKSIVSMSQSLGLKTVAEGVETIEQSEMLKSLGVDIFQGFLYAKPVPIYELEQCLRRISQLRISQNLIAKAG